MSLILYTLRGAVDKQCGKSAAYKYGIAICLDWGVVEKRRNILPVEKVREMGDLTRQLFF